MSFIVYIDASIRRPQVVLMQHKWVFVHAPVQIKEYERNYFVYNFELVAIMFALKNCCRQLYWMTFKDLTKYKMVELVLDFIYFSEFLDSIRE